MLLGITEEIDSLGLDIHWFKTIVLNGKVRK